MVRNALLVETVLVEEVEAQYRLAKAVVISLMTVFNSSDSTIIQLCAETVVRHLESPLI